MRDLFERQQPPPFVYLLRNLETLDIKIGVSAHPERRRDEVAYAERLAPRSLALVGGVQDVDAYGLERILHRRLAAHRVRGEWFSDCPEVNATLADFMRDPHALYCTEDAQ